MAPAAPVINTVFIGSSILPRHAQPWAGIYASAADEGVDGRDKPGHDINFYFIPAAASF
jgi:hypothetical protein